MKGEAYKIWQNSNPKRRKYRTEHMKKMRSYYHTLWTKGKIKYEDIPKSYCYWKNPAQLKSPTT